MRWTNSPTDSQLRLVRPKSDVLRGEKNQEIQPRERADVDVQYSIPSLNVFACTNSKGGHFAPVGRHPSLRRGRGKCQGHRLSKRVRTRLGAACPAIVDGHTVPLYRRQRLNLYDHAKTVFFHQAAAPFLPYTDDITAMRGGASRPSLPLALGCVCSARCFPPPNESCASSRNAFPGLLPPSVISRRRRRARLLLGRDGPGGKVEATAVDEDSKPAGPSVTAVVRQRGETARLLP